MPKLSRKDYEKALRKLQTELCTLQDWIKRTGERIIVIFEDRRQRRSLADLGASIELARHES